MSWAGLRPIAGDVGSVPSVAVAKLGLHQGLHALDLETRSALGAGHTALAAASRHHVSTHVMHFSLFSGWRFSGLSIYIYIFFPLLSISSNIIHFFSSLLQPVR